MRIFLLLFLLFPLAELALLIKVGGSIGVLPTILLLVISGMAGILLMRLAGFPLGSGLCVRHGGASSPGRLACPGCPRSSAAQGC